MISPPHVERVVSDAVFLQDGEELSLKVAVSMVILLSSNVSGCGALLSEPN